MSDNFVDFRVALEQVGLRRFNDWRKLAGVDWTATVDRYVPVDERSSWGTPAAEWGFEATDGSRPNDDERKALARVWDVVRAVHELLPRPGACRTSLESRGWTVVMDLEIFPGLRRLQTQPFVAAFSRRFVAPGGRRPWHHVLKTSCVWVGVEEEIRWGVIEVLVATWVIEQCSVSVEADAQVEGVRRQVRGAPSRSGGGDKSGDDRRPTMRNNARVEMKR